jgi:hypothetical protein
LLCKGWFLFGQFLQFFHAAASFNQHVPRRYGARATIFLPILKSHLGHVFWATGGLTAIYRRDSSKRRHMGGRRCCQQGRQRGGFVMWHDELQNKIRVLKCEHQEAEKSQKITRNAAAFTHTYSQTTLLFNQ